MANTPATSQPGRPAIDWDEAFAFYASLPPAQRSYQRVATEFGVSVRTVEKHGLAEGWKERVQAIRRNAAAETERTLAHAQAEQAEKYLKLIEGTLIGYADRLRRGEMRMTPADLERLHRLSQELTNPSSDRQPSTTGEAPARSAEHLAEVLAALEAAGALKAFGLTLEPRQ
jgi:hypothetical protein